MHGLPVVATRAGGMPEVVEDGRTGILVPVGDAASFAEAILRLASDPACRRTMGEAGRERALRLFSAEAMVNGVIRVYRELSGEGNIR
jgi:glycosyltransferase involved in cell wall biosynthesis